MKTSKIQTSPQIKLFYVKHRKIGLAATITLQLPVIVVVVGLSAGRVALDHVLALVHVQDLQHK